MSHSAKIIPNLALIQTLVDQYRQAGQKIVLTQGSFDMIHIGHGRYLEKAKQQGDVLIVGVDDDAKVKQRKGTNRPVVPEDERLEMLSYLKSVDHVTLKPAGAPKWQLIKAIKPDVLVATENTYSASQIKQLSKWCGQVLVLRAQAITSTSAKIRRLQIGFFKTFSDKLTEKVHQAIDEVVLELKK